MPTITISFGDQLLLHSPTSLVIMLSVAQLDLTEEMQTQCSCGQFVIVPVETMVQQLCRVVLCPFATNKTFFYYITWNVNCRSWDTACDLFVCCENLTSVMSLIASRSYVRLDIGL